MHSNSCDIWITNASVVIPKIGIVQADILIENGKIRELKKAVGKIQSSIKIDAHGKYVLPGIIDPHVHYGVFTPINQAAQTESRRHKRVDAERDSAVRCRNRVRPCW